MSSLQYFWKPVRRVPSSDTSRQTKRGTRRFNNYKLCLLDSFCQIISDLFGLHIFSVGDDDLKSCLMREWAHAFIAAVGGQW